MKTLPPLLALCFIAFIGCGGPSGEPLQVGRPTPPFSLTDVHTNQPVSSDSLKGEQAVVLNFWSVSCSACMKEMEELKAIHETGEVKVVGIAMNGSAEKIQKIAADKALPYQVLDGDEALFTQYDGFATPYTVVLDANLIVRKKISGRMDKAEFDALLESLQNGS